MRRASSRAAAIALIAVFLAGCSGAASGPRAPRANVNVITAEEIAAAHQSDAYSLVQNLRPNWLRARGASSLANPEIVQVYLDGSRLGGTDYLRQIATQSISRLQYLSGVDATQRFGLDHGAGAILVSTRDTSR